MVRHPYKLLVLDIDGTLVSTDRGISAENKEALAKARDSGVRVVLSTGRSVMSSRHIIDQLSLDNYHIFFDGALVSSFTSGEEVYVRPIDKTVVRRMVEFAHSEDIDLELFSTKSYFTERETWSTQAHRQFFGAEATIADFTGLWEREIIIKGGLVTTNPEEVTKAEGFCCHFADSLHFSQARTPAYPGVVFSNLLAPGVSKGRALETLSRYLGVSLDEVMAVGDGTNDVSLLAVAGLAVAMGNARSELKEVADYITLDVEDNGLAAAVDRFLF